MPRRSARPATSPCVETKKMSFDLAPGKYVLICNIVPTRGSGPGSIEAHYKVGIRTAFTVTAP